MGLQNSNIIIGMRKSCRSYLNEAMYSKNRINESRGNTGIINEEYKNVRTHREMPALY